MKIFKRREGNDAKMDSLITSKADFVLVPIALVPRPHLKYFCDPYVGKLFIDSDLKFYDEVKDNQVEEARLVFDPGNLWSHSHKKRYLKSKFLFEEYYEDLRTNPFEEGENNVIMGSLSMWKEFYKDMLSDNLLGAVRSWFDMPPSKYSNPSIY